MWRAVGPGGTIRDRLRIRSYRPESQLGPDLTGPSLFLYPRDGDGRESMNQTAEPPPPYCHINSGTLNVLLYRLPRGSR